MNDFLRSLNWHLLWILLTICVFSWKGTTFSLCLIFTFLNVSNGYQSLCLLSLKCLLHIYPFTRCVYNKKKCICIAKQYPEKTQHFHCVLSSHFSKFQWSINRWVYFYCNACFKFVQECKIDTLQTKCFCEKLSWLCPWRQQVTI